MVIPREIRERLNLKPGQKIHALLIDNRVVLVPVRPMTELRGLARGVDTSVVREEDRDL